MSHASKTVTLALSAFLLIGLAGCDRAEQAAESTAREVGRIAAEEARKALRSTGEAVNRGIDSAQDTTKRWLDDAERAEDERAQRRDQEAPRDKPEAGSKGFSI